MAKHSRRLSRREFLRHAAMASGTITLSGLAPTYVAPGGQESKLGAQLVGKLEGPSLVLDPTNWPKQFGEAPALAELVKADKPPRREAHS